MIKWLPCGWDSQHRLIKRGGCGIRVGYEPIPLEGYLPITPQKPHFHRSIPYCEMCYRGFGVRHLGQGIMVRPRDKYDEPSES